MVKTYFNKIVLALILTALFFGCSSNDDSGDSEIDEKRTIIEMDIPVDNDIDWNDVKIVWNEEFQESTNLDDTWNYETMNFITPDKTDGLQVYRRENAEVSGGTLKIHVKENDGVYTSARISSKPVFKYGRIEIGAKFPAEGINGIWSSIGLLGINIDEVGWPQCGEIDIVEYFSNTHNKIFNYIHSSANNTDNGTLLSASYPLESAEEEIHAYGLLWTDKYLKFYVDDPDNITYTFLRPSSPSEENWPFNQPYFLLTGMVIGGSYGGEGVDASLFPASMEIDYIRVFHPN